MRRAAPRRHTRDRLPVVGWHTGVAHPTSHAGMYGFKITVTYHLSEYLTAPTDGTLQMQYTDGRCNITVTYICSTSVCKLCSMYLGTVCVCVPAVAGV